MHGKAGRRFGRVLGSVALACVLAACAPSVRRLVPQARAPDATLSAAKSWAADAMRQTSPERAARGWLRCAAGAWRAVAAGGPAADEAAALDTQCTGRLLDVLLATEDAHWTARVLDIGGDPLAVQLRGLSPDLVGAPMFVRADRIPVSTLMFGQRFATNGFGVALVAGTRRCEGAPRCRLFPPEGITRTAVAWVEADADGGTPRLVFADPLREGSVPVGGREYVLSVDTTAPYASLADSSQLKQLAFRNLLVNGKDIGERQGVYLLEDYDPQKIPIVMLHGLGGSPLVWARLTNRIQGTPALRARYQVWHVLYQTNAPVLVSRLRVRGFLDDAWAALDPAGHDPARAHMVLVGHSLGGIIARLLTSDSGDALWHAAFLVPETRLHGDADDIATIRGLFRFTPYPGADTAFFLAAPHHGSPVAEDFFGRLALRVVKPHGNELDAIARLLKENPDAFQPDLVRSYRERGLSSISTLRTDQPVSRAAWSLLPAAGVRYYTIAGSLPGELVPGDGVVPLESTFLPGAVSTTTVTSGHRVYRNDEAIDLIVKTLGESP
jgi:pimeloyl-ACP methyl ester carboxylesterase